MGKIDPMHNLITTFLDEREVVFFLGSGASLEGTQGDKGFPGFSELIDNVLAQFGGKAGSQQERWENFLAVIKKWEDEQQLSVRLHKFFDGRPGLAHYQLAALCLALHGKSNGLLFLTSYFDNLMNRAFHDLEQNPVHSFSLIEESIGFHLTGSDIICKVKNITGHTTQGCPVIVKLFGDLNSQSPIFKQEDMRFQPEMEVTLLEWMKKTMVFIDYNSPPPVITQLLIASRGRLPVFLVNPSDDTPKILKDIDRVHHIPLSFGQFMGTLLKIIKERDADISQKLERILESRGLPLNISTPYIGPSEETIVEPWPGEGFLDSSDEKKKILLLASNPSQMKQRRFDKEISEIEEGIRRSKYCERFIISNRLAVQLRDLRRALLDHEPHILHFIGHGNTGGIIVEDERGKAIALSRDALSGLFKLCVPPLECVILNACLADEQIDAIGEHVAFVVGMRDKVKDKASIEFSIGFYDALGAGRPIPHAFQFGKNAILSRYPHFEEKQLPLLKIKTK